MRAERSNSESATGGGAPDEALASRRLPVIIFTGLLCVFVFKYHYEFVQTRRAMPLEGGPFSDFVVDARFANVPARTAAEVHVGDQMRLRGWTLATVVKKASERSSVSDAMDLRLRLRSPNWLRCYLDTSSGTEVVFRTGKYALRGRIDRVSP